MIKLSIFSNTGILGNPSSSNRSGTYDLPNKGTCSVPVRYLFGTCSDALPLSYREN